MSRQELLKIAEELSEDYEPEEWLHHYDVAMAKEPYNFVVLDRRKPVGDRWTIKFHTPFPPSKKTLEMNRILGKGKDAISSDKDE